MESEDRELVDRARAGDARAFERLVAKYNRLGGAVAFSVLADLSMVEDVVQEAFFKAYRSLATLRDGARFRLWFVEIVRRRSIDLRRTRRPLRSIDDLEEELPARLVVDERDLPDALVREEEREKVLEAMAELKEADRLVVALKHLDGLSYREIAEITGETIPAVESRLFRGRRLLRAKLRGMISKDPSRAD
jgi:RNA polymerase sigma-70 factor (ECF subfamily)